MISRRNLTLGIVGAAGAIGLGRLFGQSPEAKVSGAFPVSYSEEEWKRRLTAEQYYILREHGTERAGSSSLNREKRKGIYHCAGCDQPLFSSETKYDSGTGWPSFYAPIEGAVGRSVDNSLFFTRTEIHCANCGGHLGHVFEDGPPPTGLRYCMNGDAMRFEPAGAA